jgi:hypothetical protein
MKKASTHIRLAQIELGRAAKLIGTAGTTNTSEVLRLAIHYGLTALEQGKVEMLIPSLRK